MSGAEWSIPAVLDEVTAVAPDRDMIVWTSVRRTFAEVQHRTRRLSAFLARQGSVWSVEAAELDRWECGQSRVAILLSNCPAYLETMIAAYRARAVPYNVNHHYNAGEVARAARADRRRRGRVPPPARAAARRGRPRRTRC